MEAETRIAIQKYMNLEKRKKALEKAETELENAMKNVPKKDLEEYMNETEKIFNRINERGD